MLVSRSELVSVSYDDDYNFFLLFFHFIEKYPEISTPMRGLVKNMILKSVFMEIENVNT